MAFWNTVMMMMVMVMVVVVVVVAVAVVIIIAPLVDDVGGGEKLVIV